MSCLTKGKRMITLGEETVEEAVEEAVKEAVEEAVMFSVNWRTCVEGK